MGQGLNVQATPIQPISQLTKEHWMQKKNELLEKDE
jgi:hypothetical protein